MTKEMYGSSPHDAAMRAGFESAGVSAAHFEALRNMGLSIGQIIMLAMKYGKMLFAAGAELYALISSGNLSAASIMALVQTYGPGVEAMIKEILALIGTAYPTT